MLDAILSLTGIFRIIGRKIIKLPIRLKPNLITIMSSLEVRKSLKKKINIAIIQVQMVGQAIIQLKLLLLSKYIIQ